MNKDLVRDVAREKSIPNIDNIDCETINIFIYLLKIDLKVISVNAIYLRFA